MMFPTWKAVRRMDADACEATIVKLDMLNQFMNDNTRT